MATYSDYAKMANTVYHSDPEGLMVDNVMFNISNQMFLATASKAVYINPTETSWLMCAARRTAKARMQRSFLEQCQTR